MRKLLSIKSYEIFAKLFFSLICLSPFSSIHSSPETQLLHPTSEDISVARQLKIKKPTAKAIEIAKEVFIGEKYKKMILWMREDLSNYLSNFNEIFDAKLSRIKKHQLEREADLIVHTARIRDLLRHDPENITLIKELNRLIEVHKAQGFVADYKDSKDFIENFVGPKGKLLKTLPTQEEQRLMDLAGEKTLYVDTWAVPFFNTATQSREEAIKGIREALKIFQDIDMNSDISIFEFTNLMALFSRPEFNDVRRYKNIPFPSDEAFERFGLERSDARTFGLKYPEEAFVALNESINLAGVSFIYGQKLSIFGLISHSLNENTADGRIFTGPADFLEHDFAHAFFNLTPAIPGNPEEWEKVNQQFNRMWIAETDLKKKRMMMLVYYHFTHESGFRVLKPDEDGKINLDAFENERNVIEELLHTRHHYDYILKGKLFSEGYQDSLDFAFRLVGGFFKKNFLEIQARELKRDGLCSESLSTPILQLTPKENPS
ncbi:MAG: hypothetical protein KA116_08765 [Proteobacteria bacterium]|nr:hypothetical protein [Pseudomonadota bacterium]